MAAFMLGLWESIFTPGPTPTLLVATNVTFAALQAVLAGLLLATHSVHFVVLSALCGGLWAAINWFARELRQHQLQEEAAAAASEEEAEKKKTRRVPHPTGAARPPLLPPATSDKESETEVEEATTAKSTSASLRRGPGAAAAAAASSSSEAAEPAAETRGELKLRVAAPRDAPGPNQGSRSGVSTEDEWEKVSASEKDK